MAGNIYGTNSAKAELKVAERARHMLESALKSEIKTFKTHYRNSHNKAHKDKNKAPIKELKVIARTREGKVEGSLTGAKKIYFNSLVLDIGKHAFIQNYGTGNTIRSSHDVNRLRPKPITYKRKYHDYDLPATKFIDRAIINSGVVEFVAKEIGEIRGHQVLQGLLQRLTDYQSQSNYTKRPKSNSGYRDKKFEW